MCIARLFQAGSVDVHCTLVSDWVSGCTLHTCFRLGLWTVCRVLLHCGVRPHPTTTTTPGLLQLALRHDASDVLLMLLDLGASGEEDLDGVLGELLLTPFPLTLTYLWD